MADAPLYDPSVHTVEDNPLVRLEVYCQCGDLRRFVDPVAHVLPQLRDFESRHHGPGHGPASADEALVEREARREASFRAAGRQAEYEPKHHEAGADTATAWTPTPPVVTGPDNGQEA